MMIAVGDAPLPRISAMLEGIRTKVSAPEGGYDEQKKTMGDQRASISRTTRWKGYAATEYVHIDLSHFGLQRLSVDPQQRPKVLRKELLASRCCYHLLGTGLLIEGIITDFSRGRMDEWRAQVTPSKGDDVEGSRWLGLNDLFVVPEDKEFFASIRQVVSKLSLQHLSDTHVIVDQ